VDEVDTHRPSFEFTEYAEQGYYKHLLRKGIEQALAITPPNPGSTLTTMIKVAIRSRRRKRAVRLFHRKEEKQLYLSTGTKRAVRLFHRKEEKQLYLSTGTDTPTTPPPSASYFLGEPCTASESASTSSEGPCLPACIE